MSPTKIEVTTIAGDTEEKRIAAAALDGFRMGWTDAWTTACECMEKLGVEPAMVQSFRNAFADLGVPMPNVVIAFPGEIPGLKGPKS